MKEASILIVEDEAIIAMGIEQTLLELGYVVCGIAHDADQAFRLAMETAPDLVLMDIQIKGPMDGIDVAGELRQRHRLPVVYLTAFSDDATLQRAKVTEPYSYLIKPFEARELRVAIEIALYRHETQTKLRNMENWLSATLHSIGDAVVATDTVGAITFMNHIAEKFTGWDFTEARGRRFEEVCRFVHAVDGRAIDPLVPRVMREGIILDLPEAVEILRKDGERVPVTDSAAPLRNAEDDVIGVVVVFRNDTERMQLETRFRNLQKMEMMGQLASGMAHDFNNMLSIISGHCDLLSMERGLTPEARKQADQIGAACRRAEAITRRMLGLSRKHVTSMLVINLNDLLEQTHRLLGHVLGSHITIEVEPAPENLWVEAEQAMLEQVLINMALNARDAMPSGGMVTLSLIQRKLVPPGGNEARPFACLAVTDTGTGIPIEIQSRIFEPFFTTKQERGTGLGLSSATSIVRQHQGWMELDPTRSEGTRFWIYLPLADDPANNQDDAPPTAVVHDDAGAHHILVVEEDPELRHLATSFLKRSGYNVQDAANGKEAMLVWDKSPDAFDLMLTDQLANHPINGRDLSRIFRSLRPRLKVIYTVGQRLEPAAEMANQVGVQVLTKPYSPIQMLAAVRGALAEG